MNAYFQSQFTFNAWADERILQAIEPHYVGVPFIKKIGSHLLDAAVIWMSRLEERTSPYGVFEEHDWEKLERELRRIDRWWYEFVADATVVDFESQCHYETTEGEAQITPVGEIVSHVLYHQHYHRGQLNRAVREAGGQPAAVDYIFYQRALQAGEI